MGWISIAGLHKVETSCPPSLWGLVGQHTASQGPGLGEAGYRGLLHHPVVAVMWGELARSPAARGSRRLQMLMPMLTVPVLRP